MFLFCLKMLFYIIHKHKWNTYIDCYGSKLDSISEFTRIKSIYSFSSIKENKIQISGRMQLPKVRLTSADSHYSPKR